MRYVLLVYTDEALLPELLADDAVAGFEALGRELAPEHRLQLVGGLAPTSAATTVRRSGGEVQVTDGPFAETREQLGGFSAATYDSLAEALAHAARVPTARAGCVEVRPLLESPPARPVERPVQRPVQPPVQPERA